MNLFQFMPLFSACTTLVVGVLAFLSHPKRRINQSFLPLTVVVALWQASIFLGMSSDDTRAVMFWIHQASAFSAVVPSLIFLNRISILHSEASLASIVCKSKLWLLSAACGFVLCQTPWFLEGVMPKAPGQYLPTPDYGNGFYVFALYLVFTFIRLVYLLMQDKKRLRGTGKTEIEYILLSCGTSFFLAVFFLLAPLALQWNDLGAFLPVSGIVFAAITGYGIATGSILDAPVVTKRIISHSLLGIYLTGLYLLTEFLTEKGARFLGYQGETLPHLLATFAVVFSVTPAQGMAQRLANRLFINAPAFDVGGILRSASRELNSVLTVDQLCEKFDALLRDHLDTRDLRILSRNQNELLQIYPPQIKRRLPMSAPLPQLLAANPRLWVRDLIQRVKFTPVSEKMNTLLKEETAAAAIPFHRKGNLTGILLLGERASGRMYAQEESAAIEGLRDLFSVSYANACLYTEVQNSRIYMDLLLKHLLNGVIATDARGRINTCNEEAARILGFAPGDLTGKSVHRLPAKLSELLEKVVAEDLIVKDRIIELPKEKKETLYLNTGASLFKDLQGKVMGALLVLEDRTQLHNLEDQVRRSERLASLGTLAAGMAHEIKNPLVTLQTFTQLLPDRFHDPEYRDTFVNLAGKEIKRIDGLVNKLLTLSRPVKLDLETLSLNQLVGDYCQLFRRQATEAGAELTEKYGAEADAVHVDADQLRQVLLNLLLNALQAMPNGGTVTVITRDTGAGVELEIRDTGTGISPEEREYVFDPFFTTKSSGTGLGLAVAHQILQEHHAKVRVESIPGEGSSFFLIFPTAPAEIET